MKVIEMSEYVTFLMKSTVNMPTIICRLYIPLENSSDLYDTVDGLIYKGIPTVIFGHQCINDLSRI